MRLNWSFRVWGVAVGLTLVAALLAIGPAWLSGEPAQVRPAWLDSAGGGDRLAQAALRDGMLAQSIAFSASPPAYVSCAGEECERRLRMRLPAGVYLWMEADGASSYVGRAMHTSSSTVWVWPYGTEQAHAEPSTLAQRAQRDRFLAGRATPTPAATLTELIAALRGPDMEARVDATFAILRQGPAAAAAVPALIENIGPADGGDQQWLQIWASNALVAIGPRATLPALIDAFQHGDRDRAAGAALTLGTFGRDAASAVPILVEGLQDPKRRTAAEHALRTIEADQAAVPAASGPGILELASRKLASAPANDPTYFPLDPRHTWTERITFEPAAEGARRPMPFEGSVRNLAPEIFDGVQATTQVWSARGHESRSIVAADATGVRLLATQGARDSGPVRDHARYILRYPLEVGVDWSDVGEPRFLDERFKIAGRSWIDGFETVTVPAGTYADAVKVVFRGVDDVRLSDGSTRSVTIDATTWFAAGVGSVRYEQIDTVANDELSSGRFVVELISVDQL